MEDRPASLELRMTAVRKGQYDVEIVQSVQARRVLYDKSHEHHKNPRVKEVEWQRIAEDLQVPAACIIKRWTVIRERFASEKRKVQQLGPSSWWLMNHMDWLDVHIQPRQRGKYGTENVPILAGLPNLTHISSLTNLSNLPNLSNLSNFPTNYTNSSNNSNIRYVNVGEDDDDSRSESPIMSIAYPEVLMKNESSDEEEGSYKGSYASMEGNTTNNHHDSNDGGEVKVRRTTQGSEDSSQGPLALGLDLDESAAARMMAALKSVDDPVMRHRYRQRVHHLAEECELAAIQSVHKDRKRKEI